MCSGKGYSFEADLWSLGICLYEMVCGYFPFGNNEEDSYKVMKQVINEEITFPDRLYFKENRDMRLFIELLLVKESHLR